MYVEVISIDSDEDSNGPPINKPPHQAAPPSPAPSEEEGRAGWKVDYERCKSNWTQGEIEGYAGMLAAIERFQYGDSDSSVNFKLSYEDMDGRALTLNLEIVFESELMHI